MSDDFICENKLLINNPELHRRYTDAVFAVIQVLNNYKAVFPEYTDHSFLHTMNILEYCNKLIGTNICRMNSGEIYVLMMGAALHDTGMGISEKDFDEFSVNPLFSDYMKKNASAPKAKIIRDLHHEFSGLFIKKYAELFEIPEEFIFPIVQTARGHRVTDLYNTGEYPAEYPAGEYYICLPYVSALLRLSDELDITAERNIYLNQGIDSIHNEYSLTVWKLHRAIKSIEFIDNKCFIYVTDIEIPDINEFLSWIKKLKYVMGFTSELINSSTEYSFIKRRIIIKYK